MDPLNGADGQARRPIEGADRAPLAQVYETQRRRVWGVAYRLTGCAADADEIVQEAFLRLVAEPEPLPRRRVGPWLVRVVTNLGIDALRRRRRRRYTGPWLPSPVALSDAEWQDGAWRAEDGIDPPGSDGSDPEARYGLLESATAAFLLALEALGPRQRAVLLLRDVVGCSVRETADLVSGSEESVRALHLRARRALADYDRARCIPTADLRERHRAALERFLVCLTTRDARGLEELLAEDARTTTDAAGEYTALAAPLVGRARVARFYLAAAQHRAAGGLHVEIRLVNALPAALITLEHPVRRQAPRTVLRCELDASGRIRLVHTVLASRKLGAVFAA